MQFNSQLVVPAPFSSLSQSKRRKCFETYLSELSSYARSEQNAIERSCRNPVDTRTGILNHAHESEAIVNMWKNDREVEGREAWREACNSPAPHFHSLPLLLLSVSSCHLLFSSSLFPLPCRTSSASILACGTVRGSVFQTF